MNEKIKDKLRRGLALTVNESWNLYKYIEALEQQPKTIQEELAESEKYEKVYDDGYKDEYVKVKDN